MLTTTYDDEMLSMHGVTTRESVRFLRAAARGTPMTEGNNNNTKVFLMIWIIMVVFAIVCVILLSIQRKRTMLLAQERERQTTQRQKRRIQNLLVRYKMEYVIQGNQLISYLDEASTTEEDSSSSRSSDNDEDSRLSSDIESPMPKPTRIEIVEPGEREDNDMQEVSHYSTGDCEVSPDNEKQSETGVSQNVAQQRLSSDIESSLRPKGIEIAAPEEIDQELSQAQRADNAQHSGNRVGDTTTIQRGCSSLSPKSEECAICLETYQCGDRVVVSGNPRCPHIFHQACMVDHIWTMVYKQQHRQGVLDISSQIIHQSRPASDTDHPSEEESSRQPVQQQQDSPSPAPSSDLSRSQQHAHSIVEAAFCPLCRQGFCLPDEPENDI